MGCACHGVPPLCLSRQAAPKCTRRRALCFPSWLCWVAYQLEQPHAQASPCAAAQADEDRLAAELAAQIERAQAQTGGPPHCLSPWRAQAREPGSAACLLVLTGSRETPASTPAHNQAPSSCACSVGCAADDDPPEQQRPAVAELIRAENAAPLKVTLGGARHRLATSSRPEPVPDPLPASNGFAADDDSAPTPHSQDLRCSPAAHVCQRQRKAPVLPGHCRSWCSWERARPSWWAAACLHAQCLSWLQARSQMSLHAGPGQPRPGLADVSDMNVKLRRASSLRQRPGAGGQSRPAAPRPKSKLEELMERDLANKKRAAPDAAPPATTKPRPQRADKPWLAKGLVVKVCRPGPGLKVAQPAHRPSPASEGPCSASEGGVACHQLAQLVRLWVAKFPESQWLVTLAGHITLACPHR